MVLSLPPSCSLTHNGRHINSVGAQKGPQQPCTHATKHRAALQLPAARHPALQRLSVTSGATLLIWEFPKGKHMGWNRLPGPWPGEASNAPELPSLPYPLSGWQKHYLEIKLKIKIKSKKISYCAYLFTTPGEGKPNDYKNCRASLIFMAIRDPWGSC